MAECRDFCQHNQRRSHKRTIVNDLRAGGDELFFIGNLCQPSMSVVLGSLIPLDLRFDGFETSFSQTFPVEIILLCRLIQVVNQR